MKTKLIIGLFLLIASIAEGQNNRIELGMNVVPSYYSNNDPDILNYIHDTREVNNFVLLKNVNLDFMISENIGFQVSFQTHKIVLENSNHIIEYDIVGGSSYARENNDYRVKNTSRRYESPISLILKKHLNSKINVSMLIGGAAMVRSKKIEYEVTNKETGRVEETTLKLSKSKIMSRFSPQIQLRLQYELMEKLKLNTLVLFKSNHINNFEKTYLGAGIGISYRLL